MRESSVEIRDNKAAASLSPSKTQSCAASQGKTGLDNSNHMKCESWERGAFSLAQSVLLSAVAHEFD